MQNFHPCPASKPPKGDLPWLCNVSLLNEIRETAEVNGELREDGADCVQVEDVGQGPLLRQNVQGLQ